MTPQLPSFVSGQFTLEEKRAFAVAFIRFIEGGFKEGSFTNSFYTRLSCVFGHIAHYDIRGFYLAQFSTTERRLAFAEQCLEWPCWGLPEHTMCDVEAYLQDWVKRTGLQARLQQQLADERRATDLNELSRLKRIYEPTATASAAA